MLAFLVSQDVEMAYYWLPISAFLAAILVLFPLPSYWRSRNVPVLAIISWSFIVDSIQAVNSVIWIDNTRSVIPVWCDISEFFSVLRVDIHNLSYSATRIMIGASFALPISTLCICKYLEEVSSPRNSSKRKEEDFKRRMIIEGGMCFGLPLVFIALRQ